MKAFVVVMTIIAVAALWFIAAGNWQVAGYTYQPPVIFAGHGHEGVRAEVPPRGTVPIPVSAGGLVYSSNVYISSSYTPVKIDYTKPEPPGGKIFLFGPNEPIPGMDSSEKWTVVLGNGSAAQFETIERANEMTRLRYGVKFNPERR